MDIPFANNTLLHARTSLSTDIDRYSFLCVFYHPPRLYQNLTSHKQMLEQHLYLYISKTHFRQKPFPVSIPLFYQFPLYDINHHRIKKSTDSQTIHLLFSELNLFSHFDRLSNHLHPTYKSLLCSKRRPRTS